MDGVVRGDGAEGILFLGGMLGDGSSRLNVDGNDGEVDIGVKTIGAYLTYVSPSKVYVDTVLKYQMLEFDVESASNNLDVDTMALI